MASIKDVAQRAGVSLSTASIVINGKGDERKISAATQERVLQAMKDLNYIPNVSAKTLRAGSSQKYVVALFWNFDFRGIMMHRFLFGMQKRITEDDLKISIVVYPYQTGDLKNRGDSFANGEFNAAIIGNANGDDLEFLNNSQFSIPIILYNRYLEGYRSVNLDDEKIGYMAADHMYQQGYRRPAVISGTQNFPGATKRETSFLRRMEELGCQLPDNQMIYTGNSLKGGYECARLLLEHPVEEPADCYFCASDSIALGALTKFTEANIAPGEIGLIAIGNSDPQNSQYHAPSLSVINIPIEQMAEKCCTLLAECMYTPKKNIKTFCFDTELFARETTVKPDTADHE